MYSVLEKYHDITWYFVFYLFNKKETTFRDCSQPVHMYLTFFLWLLLYSVLKNGHISGTPTDADSLTKDDLEQVSIDLINGIQLTNFSDDINMNSNTSYSISRKIQETDSPEWQQLTSSEPGGYLVVQVADHMIFHTELEPLHEGAPFKIQPKIQVVDKSVLL